MPSYDIRLLKRHDGAKDLSIFAFAMEGLGESIPVDAASSFGRAIREPETNCTGTNHSGLRNENSFPF